MEIIGYSSLKMSGTRHNAHPVPRAPVIVLCTVDDQQFAPGKRMVEALRQTNTDNDQGY